MCNPQFGIQMEHAIEYVTKGNDVIFCHCAGIMSACSANFLQNKAKCHSCKMGFKVGLKKLPTKIKIVSLKNTINADFQVINFNSISEIKAYKYKSVELGFAVLSVYITKTRNPRPNISEDFLVCINKMLNEGIKLVDAIERLISEEKPNLIVVFNGRFFDTKPLYSLALQHNINYLITENIGGVRAGSKYKMVDFYNCIPHDCSVIYKNCLKSWDIAKLTEREKIKIGESFYHLRRNGKRAGDYIYTSNQIEGFLPESFESRKKNIVVFTSSEDEYSSVSKEIDNYYIFESQYDAIKYISENINDNDYQIIVRIHPNMIGLNVDYHLNLYRLNELNNVTVIAPEDSVSSYALMDIAYNVVVFGSTIGAECLYWEKPVVLLGIADYYEWGLCQIPKSKDDLISMIKNPTFFSGSKKMAIKYGFYFLNNGLAMDSKYINITPRKECICGYKFLSFDYLKIFGSTKLFKFIQGLINKILKRFYPDGITYPEIIRNN